MWMRAAVFYNRIIYYSQPVIYIIAAALSTLFLTNNWPVTSITFSALFINFMTIIFFNENDKYVKIIQLLAVFNLIIMNIYFYFISTLSDPLCTIIILFMIIVIIAFHKKIIYENVHDDLTGLYNRKKMRRVIKKLIIKDKLKSIAIADIDNFKNVNDTMGHEFGNKVLKKISNKFVKKSDNNYIVGRLSGDEFIFAITKYNAYKKMNNMINNGLIINDIRMDINISFGIAEYNKQSISSLLKEADINMYQAKNNGGLHIA